MQELSGNGGSETHWQAKLAFGLIHLADAYLEMKTTTTLKAKLLWEVLVKIQSCRHCSEKWNIIDLAFRKQNKEIQNSGCS